jgi:hypothetical protein
MSQQPRSVEEAIREHLDEVEQEADRLRKKAEAAGDALANAQALPAQKLNETGFETAEDGRRD